MVKFYFISVEEDEQQQQQQQIFRLHSQKE